MPKAVKPVKSQRLKCLLTNSQESGWHFLIVERKVADKFSFTDKFRRVLCSINGSDAFHCALLPWGEQFYIVVNKKRREQLGIIAGDRVDVLLERDESKYGLPMPEEIQEVLNQDPEGDLLFHALTPGKQRSMIYWLTRTKDIDRRIHEALIFLEHLKNNDGRIDSKKLQQEMKRPAY
jgi:hypothetical protein